MKIFGWSFKLEKRDLWAGPPWLNPHKLDLVLVVTAPPTKRQK